MGLCPSLCPQFNEPGPKQPRISSVPPRQYAESSLEPSEKNNDKFFYIPNEETIDREIGRLDELPVFDELNGRTLDMTLADLKIMRRAFEPLINHDSAEGIYALNIAEPHNARREEKHARLLHRKKSNTFAQNSNPPPKKKDIKNGVLTIEVQKAKYLEAKTLDKYKLVAPYVVVKIYLNKTNKIHTNSNTLQLIKEYDTLKNESPALPEWNELFEHSFVDEDRISYFQIGISLYYLNDNDGNPWPIGQEQYFSLGSLMDQKAQMKVIDFKDPIMKGVLATLMVRFQFIYDLDVVKERLLREVKARIERLLKIRERHPVFFNNRPSRGAIRLSDQMRSNMGSILSTSSNHDNDHNFYVEE